MEIKCFLCLWISVVLPVWFCLVASAIWPDLACYPPDKPWASHSLLMPPHTASKIKKSIESSLHNYISLKRSQTTWLPLVSLNTVCLTCPKLQSVKRTKSFGKPEHALKETQPASVHKNCNQIYGVLLGYSIFSDETSVTVSATQTKHIH